MTQEPDIITELAEMAFATRLKRLSERLLRDVSRIYQALNVDFEARWFSLLYGLSSRSPMTVTALAQALGLTHTAVNQLAAEMIRHKLLLSGKDRKDERKRLLRLSKKGREIVQTLTPAWEQIRAATRELIASSGHDLMAGIEQVEKQLNERGICERVLAKMEIQPLETLEIVDYRPAYKKHFRALNLEWLEELFEVEETDRKLLDDPNGRIIRKGGAILFMLRNSQVVGTCALIRLDEQTFELTKMAVTREARGQGLGRKLTEAMIARAQAMGAGTLYLQTSPRLAPAFRLYKKLGFKKTKHHPLGQSPFQRPTFTMKLELSE